MDCQQDLAINTLTILDQNNESSLYCNGNAIFKNSVKIFNNLHLFNDIRICGDFIPLNFTSSIGSKSNLWMDINASYGNFNVINTDVINVKQLNILNDNINNDQNNNKINECNKIAKYVNITNIDKKYDLLSIIHKYNDHNAEENVFINILLNSGMIILDLSNLDINNMESQCEEDDKSINKLLCACNENVTIIITLPDRGTKLRVHIINPNNYNVKFEKKQIKNNNINSAIEQSYKFVYIEDIKNWIMISKL